MFGGTTMKRFLCLLVGLCVVSGSVFAETDYIAMPFIRAIREGDRSDRAIQNLYVAGPGEIMGALTVRGAHAVTGALTVGGALGVTGALTLPLVNGRIWVGNSSGVAAAVAVSGDVTISNAGATTIGAGKVTSAMLATAAQDQIAYLTVVGADLAAAGTGTITIQAKDAAGNNLAARCLVRTWIGTADDFGPDAVTDYSVTTGTSKEEVTANAEYLAITDATGKIVMAVDNSGAGTVYAWAELGGRIVASGAVVLTAP